jgi:hypothetical protein
MFLVLVNILRADIGLTRDGIKSPKGTLQNSNKLCIHLEQDP